MQSGSHHRIICVSVSRDWCFLFCTICPLRGSCPSMASPFSAAQILYCGFGCILGLPAWISRLSFALLGFSLSIRVSLLLLELLVSSWDLCLCHSAPIKRINSENRWLFARKHNVLGHFLKDLHGLYDFCWH